MRRRWLGLRLAAALLVVVVGALPSRVAAAEGSALEYKVKAGYLFNFPKFIEWPNTAFASSNAPIVIGVLGEDPFGPMLDEALAGRNVNGRSFVIRRFGPTEDLGTCHILFVSHTEKSRTPNVLESVRGHAVLTVGESEHFARSGGMINFVLVGGQVKLETNPDAAIAANLKISSKLLAASKPVKTEPAH